jgi:hypothetical protein
LVFLFLFNISLNFFILSKFLVLWLNLLINWLWVHWLLSNGSLNGFAMYLDSMLLTVRLLNWDLSGCSVMLWFIGGGSLLLGRLFLFLFVMSSSLLGSWLY